MMNVVPLLTARVARHHAPVYASALTLAARRQFSASACQRVIVKVPQMAESLTEGTLQQWNKNVGDYVEESEEVATIETDKIDVSVNAPEAGIVTEVFAQPEDTVEVGKDLLKIEPGDPPAGGKEEKKEQPKEEKKEQPKEEKKEQPKEEKKEQPKEEKKEQPKEEKKEQPAQKPAKQPAPSPQPKADKAASAPPAPQGARTENRVKMSRMRLRIAERLKESQNTAASLTTFNEIDMTSVMEFRKRNKERVLKDTGVKLGFMGVFAKACALALQEIPGANASIDGDSVVYRDYVDLSVAVSTEKGLVTPVVRNANELGVLQIEKEIADLGLKARDNKLSLEDMTGGTFTISNGGVFGSLFGTPILNLPGSAILGMHAIKEKPWVVDGKIEIRPIMVLALTYDHRILDGREAVTFLVRLKEFLEDMPTMLL
ncbi:dihydrolipoyllysine-residue succinyltransferase [Malassezia sp. CBS 17886]|nr:dihydrolipoyllysine-residue succinyltransferase [Malassezia sp. CBS 17886]